jgi:hypothetical protein
MQEELELLCEFNYIHFTIMPKPLKEIFGEKMKQINIDFANSLNSLLKIHEGNIRTLQQMELVSMGMRIPDEDFVDVIVEKNIQTFEDLAIHYAAKKAADVKLLEMLMVDFDEAKLKISQVHQEIKIIYDLFHNDNDRMIALIALTWTHSSL